MRHHAHHGGLDEQPFLMEGAEDCNCLVVRSVYGRRPLGEATINQLPFSVPLRFLRSSV